MPLHVSIGIASGYARVGRLGSDDIKDYTAIGDVVNQAARLQAQADATEILVSQDVYREVASAYPGIPAETLVLKGFSQRTVAYRLNGNPRFSLSADSWMPEDRPAMNWSAVTLALLGSGCLGSNIAAALVLAFGGGAAGALYALAHWLDSSPARVPLLTVSTLIASIVLVSLERQRRMPVGCGHFEGLQDVLERFLTSFYAALDVHFTAQEFITGGENVVALGRIQGKTRKSGVPVDVPFAHVWTVRDGYLQRLRAFTDTAVIAYALKEN